MFSSKTVLFTLASVLLGAKLATAACDIDMTSANPNSVSRVYCLNYGLCTNQPDVAERGAPNFNCRLIAQDNESMFGQDTSVYVCRDGQGVYDMTYYLLENADYLECSIFVLDKVYPWSKDNYINYVETNWVDPYNTTGLKPKTTSS